MLRRIHVRYTLSLDEGADTDVVDRVHDFHADKCPVARSIRDAIDVSTEVSTRAGDPP